jgi:hypothetical protein
MQFARMVRLGHIAHLHGDRLDHSGDSKYPDLIFYHCQADKTKRELGPKPTDAD